MKTVDIKGKPYVTVAERIKYFRENFAGWSLESEIIELTEERCVFRAIIRNEDGIIKATGTAYELASSSYINKTSYIENCETSAWGRALGSLGIGIDASIASAEEMINAFTQQANGTTPEPITADQKKNIKALMKLYATKTQTPAADVNAAIEAQFKKAVNDMTAEEGVKVYRFLGERIKEFDEAQNSH